ncbi:NADH pyrophosphatase [Pseudoalteromonas sp. P1-30]|uniref:NUDIX domain-containing protein n=1 Tax=Pseudoalteromonas undina TaxID=43660 RepID=A0ACC6R2G3_9GAMM|nr:NUDIX domain-containing protein [Pseudoalteromonas sp. P1-30]KPV90059.1 NADH pyrophosphatase [Pseudoalteromonas sp. P1-30]|tara:strand:+ start:45429 stop:45947 length:519 start_codon:yes stop_codon:yes gene_type:complete
MFKFCPNCKSININFINQHFWKCKDCDFLYYHNAASAVAGIIKFQNKILFTIRAKQPCHGMLDLPGGFVDHNETLEQALSREVEEELGLQIESTCWQYIASFPNTYNFQNITYHTLDSVFYFELTSSPCLELQKSEISEAKWIEISKINFDMIGFASLAKALKTYLNQLDNL